MIKIIQKQSKGKSICRKSKKGLKLKHYYNKKKEKEKKKEIVLVEMASDNNHDVVPN